MRERALTARALRFAGPFMLAFGLALASGLGLAPARARAAMGDPARNVPDVAARPSPGPAAKPDLAPAHPATGVTRCDRCHTTEGWSEVSFAHERTGFPLRGAHARASCKSCHAESFTRALGRSCGSCHRDEHEGRLGSRCTACHDETTWRATFDADIHRRGNFPLIGRHAFLACEECHGDRRDLGFTRTSPACIGCHQKDFDRTGGTTIDHRAAGFSTQCQTCHQPWTFRNATFPAHEACFPIGSGAHAGVRCLECHVGLVSTTVTGTCAGGTTSCIRCHACARHPQQVAGFACLERKCYECHRFATSASGSARSGALKRLESGGKR